MWILSAKQHYDSGYHSFIFYPARITLIKKEQQNTIEKFSSSMLFCIFQPPLKLHFLIARILYFHQRQNLSMFKI